MPRQPDVCEEMLNPVVPAFSDPILDIKEMSEKMSVKREVTTPVDLMEEDQDLKQIMSLIPLTACPSEVFNVNVKTEPCTSEQHMQKCSDGELGHEIMPNPETRRALGDFVRTKRKKKGEPELTELYDKPIKYQLTKAEEQKAERRREQNRRAAEKCRLKKRSQRESSEQEMIRLKEENALLKATNDMLHSRIDYLQKLLNDHINSGNCNISAHSSHSTFQAPFAELSHISAQNNQASSTSAQFETPHPPVNQPPAQGVQWIPVENNTFIPTQPVSENQFVADFPNISVQSLPQISNQGDQSSHSSLPPGLPDESNPLQLPSTALAVLGGAPQSHAIASGAQTIQHENSNWQDLTPSIMPDSVNDTAMIDNFTPMSSQETAELIHLGDASVHSDSYSSSDLQPTQNHSQHLINHIPEVPQVNATLQDHSQAHMVQIQAVPLIHQPPLGQTQPLTIHIPAASQLNASRAQSIRTSAGAFINYSSPTPQNLEESNRYLIRDQNSVDSPLLRCVHPNEIQPNFQWPTQQHITQRSSIVGSDQLQHSQGTRQDGSDRRSPHTPASALDALYISSPPGRTDFS